MNGDFLKELPLEMKKGKSCAEDGPVEIEMLLLLPEEAFDLLAALFKDRLLNRNAINDPHVWAYHAVCLIAKRVRAQIVTDFRHIALLPVMYKWYSRMPMTLDREEFQKVRDFNSLSEKATRRERFSSLNGKPPQQDTSSSLTGTSGRPTTKLDTRHS